MALWSYPENVTSFVSLFEYGNQVTSDLFMFMVIIAIWFVIFMTLGMQRAERSFAVASFVCFVFATFMFAMNLVGFIVILLFVILSAIGGAYLVVAGRQT